ncbi:hypothetical protein [Porphyromonas canoris]|uniref:Uncharacterized protein n=1 Tax=Porphyromonas canoris TaxID=36875 RepID=A0ABR4XL93_9PORP|nr:hypothetical protein [Porphyromonas canoris]KGN92654.1 hypothetical protein HQ43_03905 [Porphyromonas canoris]
MANICTNLFYASSDRAETIDAIRAFIEENFPNDWYEQDDDFQIEAELYSRWDFPQSLFEDLSNSLSEDNTLYMRYLSHELCNEYACLSVYRDGEWAVGI